MVISMDEYTSLRREFLKVAKFYINSTALEELKLCYAEAIKSARALDRIDDVEGLIRILEKRGVVRYNLVTPLKHIARKYFNNSGINSLLDDYEARVKSQGSSYLDKTNLYQFGNGEFFWSNGNLNRLSCPQNVYPRSRVDDLSDFNNSAVSVTPYDSEVPSLIDLRDNFDIEHKECNVQVLPYHIRERDLEKLIDRVVSRVLIPPVTVNVENERDKQSTTEDLDKTEEVPETRLLATPQSAQLQNPVCFSVINKSNSKENLVIDKRDFRLFFKQKYIQISFVALLLAVLLSLIIVYGFSKTSVHYIPTPSAPFPSGPIEAPSTPYPGFITRENATQPAYNVTQPPVTSSSLQKLSPKEAQIQKLVFERVSCEVGSKWREVARRLDVRENFIDQIQAQHHLTLQEKALKIFYKFAEDTDLKQWRRTLMKALEDARRKDLRELVEDLVSREY